MPYRLRGLTRATQIALAAQAGVSALAAAVGTDPSGEDPLTASVALTQVIVFIAAAACFLTWTYRAKANSMTTGTRGLSFSPLFSVGSHFLPLINLVVPVQAMQELYKSSADPRDWEAVDGSAAIWLWWLFWIVGNAAGVASARLQTMEEEGVGPELPVQLGMASDLGTLCASLLLMRIVGRIGALQQRLRDTMEFQ